jgi:hypothetical protein
MSSQFEERLMAENHGLRERNAELRQQNSQLRQRNAELQKALKPFASRSLPEENENWDGQLAENVEMQRDYEWIRSARFVLAKAKQRVS